MALNAVGGLAQGLAQGIDMGMRWHGLNQSIGLQKQRQERLEKRDERDAEIHEMKKDQFASEKEIRDRRNNALNEIAQYTQSIMGGGPQPQQQPNINVAGPIPAGGIGGATQMTPDSGSLAPAASQAAQAQAPQAQEQSIPPGKVLERGMVTGMYSPKMLTDIASIWAKHGLQEEGIKYMNQAYEAEKRGGVRASMALMQNNPAAAAKALQEGGVELEGVPVKVNDDPNDFRWKLNIAGQGETTADVRQWLRSTMDPEEFFRAEDRRIKDEREAAMDERKQSFAEQKGRAELGLDAAKTQAQIGYLRSRSQLAEANADKADRWEPGALRPTRSSESQINTALTRREKAFDRVSMVKDEFGGKPEVDPMRRQVLDSAANQYQAFLEDLRGEELDARDHHKFTDVMVSFPVNGTPQQIAKWEESQLFPRFGLKRKAKAATKEDTPRQVTAPAGGLAPASTRAPAPRTGALSSLDRDRASAALNKEMEGVQRALKTPNLSTEQRKTLSLQAQEIAKRRDALKRKRGQSSDPESEPVPDYGLRRDGSKKGTGWLGIQKTKSGSDMTEYTVGLEINGNEVDVPTLVPTLNQKEIDYLKTEPDLRERSQINDSIIRKAKEHAEKRMREGKSVFAD